MTERVLRVGRNLEKSSQLKLNPTVSVCLCALCKGERVEGTTSAPTGMCGGAGTLRVVGFLGKATVREL